MADLIDREAAIRWVKTECNPYGKPTLDFESGKKVIEHLRQIPSAKPERKVGRWINYKDEHCCSVCDCVIIEDCWDEAIRYDYCPYCGADMRGEE